MAYTGKRPGNVNTDFLEAGGELENHDEITVDASGNITATSFSGDGANLTGINTDLVSDTTPQLGGNLDLNSNNITGTGNIPAGNLTGALPAIDGSALTGISGGKVLQVARDSLGGNVGTTSTSPVASGLSITFTPLSATSRLHIHVIGGRTYRANTTGQQIDFYLYDGTTDTRLSSLWASDSSGYHTNGLSLYINIGAGSTATRTYSIRYRTNTGTGYFQHNSTDMETTMLVMEVEE